MGGEEVGQEGGREDEREKGETFRNPTRTFIKILIPTHTLIDISFPTHTLNNISEGRKGGETGSRCRTQKRRTFKGIVFGVQGSEFRVQGVGLRVKGVRFGV